KWQRRFFVIYETGELCYQLDDNPSTSPQGTVNMYSCTEVYNAKNSIGHDHSMGIVTPDGTLFIKAETREEKDSWFIVLSEYPKINQETEKYKKRKKKKEEREGESGSSNIPVRIDSSKEVSSSSSAPSDSKPTSSSLGRISSFKENIQPHKRSPLDSKSEARLTSSLHLDSGRTSHLKESDQFNFRRSRSLREKRNSRATVEEEDDHQTQSSTDTASGEEKEKEKTRVSPSTRKSRTVNDRLPRRHTSPVKHVDFPTPDVSKLKRRDKRLSGKGKEDSSDEELDHKQSDKLSKDGLNSEYMETLQRNNNNVYKSDHIQSSVSHIPKRKNSTSESGSGRSSRTSSISEVAKTAAPPQATEPTESAVLTDEEIARLDVPKRGRMRFSKLHGDGETQSPSKRTIEKRRHAKDRRSRHTLDGSIRVIPVLDSDRDLTDSQKRPNLKLKRSNSDPNLADTEDALQRKEIAEIFPGLYHLKNGWLNLMGDTDNDWTKHWFVLKDNKLSFHKDSKDDVSNLEGSYNLAGSLEAVDFNVGRNYGFKVKMRSEDEIVLSAMTAAIRTKWVIALNKAILTARDSGDVTAPLDEETLLTQKIEDVSESVPDKPTKEDGVTEVDSNKIEAEEVIEEQKLRAPSQRIRDRRSRRGSREDSKRDSTSSRLSSESEVFFDAVTCLERRQPEGRSDSPDKGIADTQSGEINEVLGEAVDALKARLKVVEDENVSLKMKNSQLVDGIEVLRKYPLENTADVELLNQMEKLVKHRSKLEQEMEDEKMKLKQMKNAAELTDQKNRELQDQVGSVKDELEKKCGDYNNLQSRFEKLVMDLKEMETERSTSRTKLKEEREATLDIINRLNQRIDDLENENLGLKDEIKQERTVVEAQKQKCEELEKRLASQEDEYVIVEQQSLVQATPGNEETGDKLATDLKEQLDNALRENRGLLAQLQGANRSTQMLRHKLKEKEEKVTSDASSQGLEEFRAEIGEKEDEIEALNERLKVVEETRGNLQVKYDKLVEETSVASPHRVTELEAQLTQVQDLRLKAEGRISAVEAERDSLMHKVQLCQSQIEKLGNSNVEREDESILYKEEIDQLKEALSVMTTEKTNLNDESTKLREEVEESTREIAAKEEVLEMLQQEMKRVKSEWRQHRHEVDKLKKENDKLHSNLDSANAEAKSLQDKVEKLEQRHLEGLVGAGEPTQEVAQLKEELVRARSSSDSALKNLELEMASKQEQLQMISTQAEDYQKQLQLLSDALKDKAEAVLRLEEEVASKDHCLSSTQEQLTSKSDRLEKEVKRLRSQLTVAQKEQDEREIKHRVFEEQQTQVERTNQEEMKLMSDRIQDLTAKLSSAEKKASDVDQVLKDHKQQHQKTLDDLKQSYTIKMRSMEESKRKEQEVDSEALSTALEAVKRVYEEQLQEELSVMQAGTTKDVDSMMRRHTDVVSHMNKDWIIMSGKFSELCRENAQLTSTNQRIKENVDRHPGRD
ncbi:hypothetical protein BSL78_05512, partial [Apostichopus japonicus]